MPPIDKLATLRARANKAKNRSEGRVSTETLYGIITSWLDNPGPGFTTVESVYLSKNPSKSLSSIAAAFNKAIKENALDELCYAVAMDDSVYLTMLVEDEDENDGENDA